MKIDRGMPGRLVIISVKSNFYSRPFGWSNGQNGAHDAFSGKIDVLYPTILGGELLACCGIKINRSMLGRLGSILVLTVCVAGAI